ncbi:hypothetical protein [Fibrella forsythiae]|uniref:DUF4136 domain-containing protein n=1 Tax=Fibrella forsythiae TaxID=2817061 RepID=A0ABS3JKM4_9BACT|nr:hypothetical protein [Fibrella forsythiae]MBO0949993.1 hypothetical protein [Fibrella forsythiae]
MKACLLILCSLLANLSLAQDHLTPAEGYFSRAAQDDKYYSLIQNRLLKGLSAWPLAKVVVLPSFEEEYVVTVDSVKGSYYVMVRSMENDLWSIRNDSARVQTAKYLETRRRIKPDLAKELNRLFFDAVSQTRYPPIKYDTLDNGQLETMTVTIADGVRYHFTAYGSGFGVRGGETHSPEEGSLMGQLVALTGRMVTIAEGNTKESEQTLKQAAQALHRKLLKPLR